MKKTINILYFMDSAANAGGIQEQVYAWIKNINHNQFHIDILAYRQLDPNGKPMEVEAAYAKRLSEFGTHLYIISPMRKGYIGDCIKETKEFLKENAAKYEILHAHASSKAINILYYAKKYGIKNRIIHSHNIKFQTQNKFKQLVGWIFKIPMKFLATDYYACSEDAAKWLYKGKIYNSKLFFVAHNAIDIDKFHYNQEVRTKIRNRFGWNDKHVLINVARFHPQKNHSFLIDVFNEVHKRDAKSILVLVGTTVRGEMEVFNTIKEKIKQYGIEECVYFLGLRTDIHDILQGADCFVFTSVYEGLGIVCVEAQASGLPCVISAGVPKEVKISNNVCFCSLKDSLDEWAVKIIEFCLESDKRSTPYKAFQKKGYDIKTSTKQLEERYIEMADELI